MASRRSARILAGVRDDIDRFLDPSVLSLAAQEVNPWGPATAAGSAAAQSPLAADAAADAAHQLELLELRSEAERLRVQIEEAREEAAKQCRRAELQQGREAQAVARLEQRCEQLESECRAGRRRAADAESRLLQVETERDTVRREGEEAAARARRREEELAKAAAGDQRRLQEELAAAKAVAASGGGDVAREVAAAEESAGELFAEKEALRDRIVELEHEVAALRLALGESAPARALGERLRQQYEAYEAELRGLRDVGKELKQARSQVLRLEQENASLKAALEARDAALREVEDTIRSAALAKQDFDALASVADAIITDVQLAEAMASGAPGGLGPAGEREVAAVTPLELSLAWAKCQAELGGLRRKLAELHLDFDRVAQRERRAQADLRSTGSELSVANARFEESQLELRRARDDAATQKACAEVLREAISRSVGGHEADAPGPTAAGAAAEWEALKSELVAAKQHAADYEGLARSRQEALEHISHELEGLRAESVRLADAEAKVGELQRVNAELWSANRDLEQQQERLAAEIESRDAQVEDYDVRTTKVLHLVRGPHGQLAPGARCCCDARVQLEALRAENATLRVELEQGGTMLPAGSDKAPAAASVADLQRRQAERQLDRFKKATRKYVQEFREGVFGLLGWKVDMKGEGGAMCWHLASRYQEGRELVFKLRPGEPGRTPAFDLLDTEWAAQLQADRQAMAWLEVYGSIPGFLASVTSDLLSQKTLQG